MKCLFGYNEKTKLYRSDEFIIRALTDEQLEKIINLVDEKFEDNNSRRNYNWMPYLGKVFIVLAFFFALMLVFIKNGFEEVTEGIWLFFILAGILVLVGIAFFVIYLINKKKEKNNVDYNNNDSFADIEYMIDKSNQQLGIPSTAISLEIIGVDFKDDLDNDEDTHSRNFIRISNDEYDVFVEDDKLCFSDSNEVVGIPLSSITEIKEIKEDLLLKEWHKTNSYDSYDYMEYNIRKSKKGFIIPSYLRIAFNINGSDYYFSIPNYDAEDFKKLINKYQSNINLK